MRDMTTGSWIFMLAAWAAVIALAGFCFTKILTKGRRPPPGGAP